MPEYATKNVCLKESVGQLMIKLKKKIFHVNNKKRH